VNRAAGAGAAVVEASVVVSGRVQGVSFRAATREAALGAAVSGWVRNLPDGSVEALLQGSRPAVERVVEFMRRGPYGARVDRIDVSWGTPGEEWDGFSVRYGR
jgi:acylphosphatase